MLGTPADDLFSTSVSIATAGRGKLSGTALAYTTPFRYHGGAEPSWNTT